VLAGKGNPTAVFDLGVLQEQRGDLDSAIASYRAAAEGGVALAATNLAGLLRRTGKADMADAALDRAMKMGDPLAFVHAGLLVGKPDPGRAERLLRHAAEAGEARGAAALAQLLFERDEVTAAIKVLRPFAKQGDPISSRLLGIYYESLQQTTLAEHWFSQAAR